MWQSVNSACPKAPARQSENHLPAWAKVLTGPVELGLAFQDFNMRGLHASDHQSEQSQVLQYLLIVSKSPISNLQSLVGVWKSWFYAMATLLHAPSVTHWPLRPCNWTVALVETSRGLSWPGSHPARPPAIYGALQRKSLDILASSNDASWGFLLHGTFRLPNWCS